MVQDLISSVLNLRHFTRHARNDVKSKAGQKSLECEKQAPAGDVNLGVADIQMTFEPPNHQRRSVVRTRRSGRCPV
jgi:hypothetical protein